MMEKAPGTGTLPFGITIDGVTHREFELRPSTLGDNIDAIDEVGADNQLKLSVAMMARQLVRLGSLPKDKIDTALLKTLRTEDWNALDIAALEFAKKSVPLKSG